MQRCLDYPTVSTVYFAENESGEIYVDCSRIIYLARRANKGKFVLISRILIFQVKVLKLFADYFLFNFLLFLFFYYFAISFRFAFVLFPYFTHFHNRTKICSLQFIKEMIKFIKVNLLLFNFFNNT